MPHKKSTGCVSALPKQPFKWLLIRVPCHTEPIGPGLVDFTQGNIQSNGELFEPTAGSVNLMLESLDSSLSDRIVQSLVNVPTVLSQVQENLLESSSKKNFPDLPKVGPWFDKLSNQSILVKPKVKPKPIVKSVDKISSSSSRSDAITACLKQMHIDRDNLVQEVRGVCTNFRIPLRTSNGKTKLTPSHPAWKTLPVYNQEKLERLEFRYKRSLAELQNQKMIEKLSLETVTSTEVKSDKPYKVVLDWNASDDSDEESPLSIQ